MSVPLFVQFSNCQFPNYLKYLILHVLDPLTLTLGKEYNLNTVKEFEVTDDFLNLDFQKRDCQNQESMSDCKTRLYREALLTQCKCLPFNIRVSDEVIENLILKLIYELVINF